ncbi:MAG: RNA polymerase sigma factor [Myxococcota bacterium]
MSEPALRLVRDGDARFPEELYARLAPLVNKLLWTLLGPDPERDDLAHEIFLRILRNADKLRDPSRLEAWAARVTVNAVKNEFRSRKLRRLFSLGVDEEELTDSYHPDFEGRELLLRTYRVLMLLPTRERLPLTLHLVGQEPLEQIALACDTSVRTLKRRLRAARERFARLAAVDPLLAERLRYSKFDGGNDE